MLYVRYLSSALSVFTGTSLLLIWATVHQDTLADPIFHYASHSGILIGGAVLWAAYKLLHGSRAAESCLGCFSSLISVSFFVIGISNAMEFSLEAQILVVPFVIGFAYLFASTLMVFNFGTRGLDDKVSGLAPGSVPVERPKLRMVGQKLPPVTV